METVKTKHTPLPFEAFQVPSEKPSWRINATKLGIFKRGEKYIAFVAADGHNDSAEHNAKFIVEACNSYYQLKEQTSLLKSENEKLKAEIIELKEEIKVLEKFDER